MWLKIIHIMAAAGCFAVGVQGEDSGAYYFAVR